MILSLVSVGVAILNAAAFLLMASGQSLLDYIIVSSIFAIGSSLYTWLLPAAIRYDPERLPLLRLLQAATVLGTSAVIVATQFSAVGMIFIGLMVAETIVFPAHMLLFRSKTTVYLRSELARGVANSVALVVVLILLGRDPVAYAALLAINVVVAGIALAAAGVHHPPSLKLAPLRELSFLRSRALWSPQLCRMLLARGTESGALVLFSHFQAISQVLSLKIAMSISSALAINARSHSTGRLLAAHVGVYVVGTAGIIAARSVPALPVPATLKLIDPRAALAVLPVALTAFTLAISSLRVAAAKDGVMVSADPA